MEPDDATGDARGVEQALYEKHADKQVQLWRMRKGERELTCVAVHTLVGLDLRLLENGEMLRTELFRDGYALHARAKQWGASSISVGVA